MSDSYKGIIKLDNYDGGQFPSWKRLVLGYFSSQAPKSYAVITTPSDDEIAQMPPVQALAARVVANATASERARHDEIAGADILRFLGPEMNRLHVRTKSGKEMWLNIVSGFEEWRATQAPALQREFQALAPRTGEGVEAYCNRALMLAEDMRDVGREVNDAFLIDAVLQGLVRERPAWQPVLLGLRGAMTGRETLRSLRGRLVEAESRDSAELAPAAAARAATTVNANDMRMAELLAEVRALQAQLNQGNGGRSNGRNRGNGRGSGDGASTSGRGAQPTHVVAPDECLRCGSKQHRAKNCPHPPHRSRCALPPVVLKCWNDVGLGVGAGFGL
jgi:hypothetical protein